MNANRTDSLSTLKNLEFFKDISNSLIEVISPTFGLISRYGMVVIDTPESQLIMNHPNR